MKTFQELSKECDKIIEELYPEPKIYYGVEPIDLNAIAKQAFKAGYMCAQKNK